MYAFPQSWQLSLKQTPKEIQEWLDGGGGSMEELKGADGFENRFETSLVNGRGCFEQCEGNSLKIL